MKLSKIQKILPGWERIRVWGKDDEHPLYDGAVEDLPIALADLKFKKSNDTGSYFDIRYDCSDIAAHVAVFVQEN